MSILRCDKVVKSYPTTDANNKKFTLSVEQLSIDKPGIYVLLGLNGAGKTTFIKLILHLLLVDAGRIELLDLPHTNPKARTYVGYVPEEFSFPNELRFIEAMVSFGSLPHSRASIQASLEGIITALNLDSLLRKRVAELSRGELQMLAISQALLGNKKLLICDEPLNGLDPIQKDRIVEYLCQMNASRNLTVLFSTHVLAEAEDIYTSVILVREGRIQQPIDKSNVRKQYGSLRDFFHHQASVINTHTGQLS